MGEEEEEEDYEEEEEGGEAAATAGTAGSETTDGAHGRGKRRASMSRREILQSRGGDGTKGSVGRVQTGDVQRKAELREPKTPGAADKRRKRTGGDVRFGEDSDAPSRPESRAIPSRMGTGISSRPMTGR
jgi:pyruvate/2-oxoglutarate dehydrogenase complex dihydrolipoamide acyltransferase (E2) component